jgi:phosphohistidine phosphatase
MHQDVIEVYLLRHAHAGDPAKWTGDDAERPLSAKGRRQAERLGTFLAERGFQPDAIVTSPKLRARETAELVGVPLNARIETDQRLAGALDTDLLAQIIEDVGGGRVVLVGHDPDFSELAAALCGAHDLPLKKGTLVRIDVAPPLREGSGLLRWLVPPDLIESPS